MSFLPSGSASPPHLVNGDDGGKERDMMERHKVVRTDMEEPSLMDERQVMERRQEINRIEQMGKVQRSLKQHIAAKIGRNLQAKIIHGPLREDEDASNSEVHSPKALDSPSTSPKPVQAASLSRIAIDGGAAVSNERSRVNNHLRMPGTRRKPKPRWIVGRRNLGELHTSFEEDQKKELEDLKSMEVVKSHLSNRRRANHLANRMFNRRVNNSRTKTSILLTGSEPDQEEVMKAMRNMNRFVIEKFLQTQSQNRRVLERLNSRYVRAISDIEVAKAKKPRRLSDSSLREVKIIEEVEEREKMEERKGVKRPHKRASMSSLHDLITTRTETPSSGKISDKLHKLWEQGVQSFRSKKESVSATISKRKSKKGWKKGNAGSRRRRRRHEEREKMAAYRDDDDAISKSSSSEEFDVSTCSSPPFYSGLALETLFERTTPVPVDDSTEIDKATSPLSSSGGVFLPALGPPLVQPQYTHSDTSAPLLSPPQSPPANLPLATRIDSPTSASAPPPPKPAAPPSFQAFGTEKPVFLSGAFFSPPQSPPANQPPAPHKDPPTAPPPPKPTAPPPSSAEKPVLLSGAFVSPPQSPPANEPLAPHKDPSTSASAPPPPKPAAPPASSTEKPVLLSGAFFSPPQSPPANQSPAPQKPAVEAPPTSQALDAPPTFRASPPPPFQAHGILTSITSDDVTLHEHDPPSDGLAPSPNAEVTPDAVTPVGYQIDTESQEPSQEFTACCAAPLSVMQERDQLLSTEDCLQESSPKRAKFDDGTTNHNICENLGAFPILQSQVVAKSGQVIVPQFSCSNGERSDDSKRRVEDDGYPAFNKAYRSRPPTVLQSQVVPTHRSGPAFVQDSSFLNGERLDILGEAGSFTLESFGREYSEVERDGVVEGRPGVSGSRVVHEEALVCDEEEEEGEGEEAVQRVEERVASPDRKQPSPSTLHSSSLESKSDNITHISRTPKRHFSSPYISTASRDESNFLPKLKPKPSGNHAYYTPIEIDEEFNPFNYEFEQGWSEEVRPKESRVEADSAGINLNQFSRSSRAGPSHSSSYRSPRTSPGQPLMSSEVKRKERRDIIPTSAYKDPKFLQHVKTLSHEPTYDDYQAFRVSQRLLCIGDNIEVRYKDKLDLALDNIFMDIIKESFTFDTFKAVAGRLLFEGKQIQDSLFLIPLFARRLKEVVSPQQGDVVGNYTKMFMDNFVTKYLMSVGGWGTIVENYGDGDGDAEVYDEHPDFYLNGGGHLAADGNDNFDVYHLEYAAANNYDHLYDGSGVQNRVLHIHVPHQLFDENMNEVNQNEYYLDTYEGDWQPPAQDNKYLLKNEDHFLSYLAIYHPFLLEPGYLRRVNSVDVLFQDQCDSEVSQVAVDGNGGEEALDNYPPSTRRRKRSSQVSLARSLSLDSLASPGLSSGMFCASPTVSANFLAQKINRSASRGAAPPVESPVKRGFPTHSPIHEHVECTESHVNNASIAIVLDDTNQKRPSTLPRPHPLPLSRPHTPTLPRPHTPVHVPSMQNSANPSLPSTPPSYEGQSSEDNYDSLYDSPCPFRSNTSHSTSIDPVSDQDNKTDKTGKTGTTGLTYRGIYDDFSASNNPTTANEKTHTDTKKWVVPVAIVTIGGVALIAGYYYMKRRS